MPFGEYVPFRSTSCSLDPRAAIRCRAISNPATGRASSTVAGHQVATIICFESRVRLPGPAARARRRAGDRRVDQQPLVRRSANSAQHVAIGQIRAAETGRPRRAGRDLGHLRDHRRQRRRAPTDQAVRSHRARGHHHHDQRTDARTSATASGRSGCRASCSPAAVLLSIRRVGLRPRSRERTAGFVDSPANRSLGGSNRRSTGRRSTGRHAWSNRMTERKDRLEHTLEVLVYAPIGVGLYLRGHGPDVRQHVRRPRSRRDRSPPGAGAATHDHGARASARSRSRSASRWSSSGSSARSAPRANGRRRCSDRSADPTPATAHPSHRRREPAAGTHRTRADGSRRLRRRPRNRHRPTPTVRTPIPCSRSRVTTLCRRRRSSSVWPACPATSSRRCARYEASNRKRRTILGKIDQISA